ncbi:MAG: ABC transporter permease [Deltaproteobacteria bacterium]|nr:ABC transporter permease [Deltaproteobacteria bacterium]
MSAQPIIQLGHGTTRFVLGLGEAAGFAGQILASLFRRPLRVRRILDEIYGIGVLSLSIILLSGLVVGLVLGLQGYTTLVRFGAEQNLGAMVGLVLIREMGPVLTALLITGRAGSAVAAEIGSMVVTEQLDGLRMMSIEPVDYVVKPKVVAMVLSMPLLAALFTVMGILGGWIVGVIFVGGDSGVYLSSLESSVVFREDVLGSLIKTLVFGILVALIATWRGFTARPSAAGVSAATTSTVVSASVFVLIFNYFITALWRF